MKEWIHVCSPFIFNMHAWWTSVHFILMHTSQMYSGQIFHLFWLICPPNTLLQTGDHFKFVRNLLFLFYGYMLWTNKTPNTLSCKIPWLVTLWADPSPNSILYYLCLQADRMFLYTQVINKSYRKLACIYFCIYWQKLMLSRLSKGYTKKNIQASIFVAILLLVI